MRGVRRGRPRIAGCTDWTAAEGAGDTLPRHVEFGGRHGIVIRYSADDENVIVVRKQKRQMVLTGSGEAVVSGCESCTSRIEHFGRREREEDPFNPPATSTLPSSSVVADSPERATAIDGPAERAPVAD